MRAAYLACRLTLPDSPERRGDAFEHDQMMDCLTSAFGGHGSAIEAVAWDDPNADWSAFDAVLIGSAWDYQDNLERFQNRLADIESHTRLFNDSATVAWNCRKTYLRDLAGGGVRTVPTVWLDRPAKADIGRAFDTLDCNDLVLKRQVGANAEGQVRLQRGDLLQTMSAPMMAQPFLQAIQSEGEISFVIIDGDFSHALIKSAAPGEYRIQSAYGGSERAYDPAKADINTATGVIEMLNETPLYARVDMVRGDDGALLLMELELIEPFLYPLQGPELGQRIYRALARRLSTT